MAWNRWDCVKHNHTHRIGFLWTMWFILPYLDERRSFTWRLAHRISERWCFKHEERECQVENYVWPLHARLAYRVAVQIGRLSD